MSVARRSPTKWPTIGILSAGFRPGRLVSLIAVVTIVLANSAACRSTETRRGPSVTSAASSLTQAGPDLSRVLVCPDGFEYVPKDPSEEGPGHEGEIHRDSEMLEADEREKREMLSHGFNRGYYRAWKMRRPTQNPRDWNPKTLVTAFAAVFEFDTPDHARYIFQYSRGRGIEDGHRQFDVAGLLPGGQGEYIPPTDKDYLHTYDVYWVHGRYVFDLMVSYKAESSSDQVVSLAIHQESAASKFLP